ncbi:MAG: LPS-assembly protein LptD [Nitrospinae bacterium]|nr:LPS-assembly protein LptD [Nitrospinota bacterium]
MLALCAGVFYLSSFAVAEDAKEDKLSVTADNITFSESTGVMTARGNAKVLLGSLSLHGDQCLLNKNTGNGLIEGNVWLKIPQADVTGRMMEFNLNTGLGTLWDAQGVFSNELTFSAQKIQRTAPDQFSIENGAITSCPPENQEWVFNASSLDVKLEGLAILKDVSLRFYGVPVFYSPYWFAPAVTKRTSGFLMPGVGHSSTSGTFLKNSFFWAISEQDDATFYLDYMDMRGAREGIEYRYAFAERTRGQLNFDYLNDRRFNDQLWSVKYNHIQQYADNLEGRINVDAESNVSYSREFDNQTFMRTRRYTDSSANLHSAWDTFALSLTGRDQRELEATNGEIFSKRPEVKFSMMPQRVFGTPLVADAQATSSSFFSSANSNAGLDRLDVRPTLALPFSAGPYLNMNPWVAGRAAWYSRGAADTKPLTAEYYSAGLGIEGPRMFRVFEGGTDAFKHSLTPMLDYTYVPGYEVDGTDRQNILQLDGADRHDPKNLLTMTLLNRVYSRSRGDEAVRLNIQQGYDLNEAARSGGTEKRPWTALMVELKSRPAPWLLLNADLTYNHYDQNPDTVNEELGIAPEGLFYFSYDRRFTRVPLMTYSSGLIGYRFSNAIAAEASAIYDEVLHESAGTLLSVKLDSCCWGVSLTAGSRVRTEPAVGGGTRRETETRFFLGINLKGIGDIGEKPSPLIDRKL